MRKQELDLIFHGTCFSRRFPKKKNSGQRPAAGAGPPAGAPPTRDGDAVRNDCAARCRN
jgi:hypothetical protein